MARPKKAIRRDQQLNVSLTVPELATLYTRAQRAGMTLIAFARWRLLGSSASDTPAGTAPEANQLLLADLKRVGNNLNQLVRLFHREKHEPPSGLDALLDELRRLINRELAGDR